MHRQRARRCRAFVVALTVPGWLAAAGCGFGPLPGRATEEWTRNYPLAAGGELRIGNTNGKVEIEGVDGSMVEVHAQKIARAATDAGARDLLPRISINEDVTPGRVSIETGRMAGVMIGAGFEVQYHVKAPRGATVEARTTNGVVTLTGLTGKVVARTTNGGVRATALSGAVDAQSTNGGVNVDVASLAGQRIALRTTNGAVTLSVPETAKADVVATWTNGGMNVSGLALEISEQGRRRFEGKMNGGGTPIELHTTNGGIRLRARDVEAQK